MMTKVSENTLTAALASILSAPSDHQVPLLSVLLPEFDARQGRADLVGVTISRLALRKAATAGWGRVLARPAAASVYSFTSFAPRTESFLVDRTGLSRATVRSCVGSLCDTGLVKALPSGSLVRLKALPAPEVWAFEVKVANWRRALFQALQYQAFAHRVSVVMPHEFAHRALAHRDLFRTLGVGLLVLQLRADGPTIRQPVPPRKREPSSGAYHMHALGRIIGEASAI